MSVVSKQSTNFCKNMVTFKGQFIKGIIEVNTLQAFHKVKKDPYHCENIKVV